MLIVEHSKHTEINTDSNSNNEHYETHVFTQYFIHKDNRRKEEIQYCLLQNCANTNITSVHLLNERIYTEKEMGMAGNHPKIKQCDIHKRLSFKDVFDYVIKNDIKGYLVLTNADIFFDETLERLQHTFLSQKKQMMALLRHEFRGEKDLTKCPVFGPRHDSQDTWILHSSMLEPSIFQNNVFQFEFGKPGCDNKMAYLMLILGFEIFNDCKFIKTYHYHTNQSRDYTIKDRLMPPYALVVPSGLNIFKTKPSMGIDPVAYVEFFKHFNMKENDLLYEYISIKIKENKPFIIPRICGHENNCAHIGFLMEQNINNVDFQKEYVEIMKKISPILKNNAGIQISNGKSVVKYSQMYLKAFENCEMYAGWEPWGHYIHHIKDSHKFICSKFNTKHIFWAFTFDVYHFIHLRPFTHALQGKRILIVSSFEESIRAKIDDREKIYGIDLFPNCQFVFIKPPLTNGKNPSKEFDVELESFFQRLDALRDDYDVALLACGGYGNLVANYIYENHQKSAIYIGGVLQMYFGIYGGRWLKERKEILQLYMNSYWSRPSEKERNQVIGTENIENGCYW